MSAPHLSALELDEIAAELAPRPPHLDDCQACRDRLAALQQANAAILARPEANSLAARLVAQHSAPPARRAPPALLFLAPLAASLLLFFAWPRPAPDTERLKGAAIIVLLDAKGEVVTRAKVGEQLDVAVRFDAEQAAKVTVFAQTPGGERAQLFSGQVEPRDRRVLTKVEVTPGDVELTADFERPGQPPLSAKAHLEVQ